MKNQPLVYGFGPFRDYTHNVTADIVREVNRLGIAKGIVFDTKFSRSMFHQALKKYSPAVVIGMGQTHLAKKIRLERKARNQRSVNGEKVRFISPSGPKYRFVSLKMPATKISTVTYNAGTYVCNYSMYVMCEYCEKTGTDFAFLHVPLNSKPKQVANYVKQILKVWKSNYSS